MIRWLKSLFAWRDLRRVGVWVLSENAVTGQRCATWVGGCYGPLATGFIRNGDIVDGPRGRYVVGSSDEMWI